MNILNSVIIVSIVSTFYTAILFFLNYLQKRKIVFFVKYSRRVVHLISGLIDLSMAFILHPLIFIIVLLGFTFVMFVSQRKNIFFCVHQVERKTYGEVFFAMGILIAYLLSKPLGANFVAAVLVLSLADLGAGIAGDFSKAQKKTILGSVVFFIITLIILFCLYPNNLIPNLIISLIVTIVERYSNYGFDNLTISPVVVLVLKLFHL